MKASPISGSRLFSPNVFIIGFVSICTHALVAQTLANNGCTNHLLSIDFATVGDAGNAADPTTGYGTVGSDYQIGKYDITAEQYCAFLNAVAKKDPHGLYSVCMATDPNVACIQRYGVDGNYGYLVIKDSIDRKNFPITYVSWFSAARFCNWLHNGQPHGNQDATTTERGAYALNGAMNLADTQDITFDICDGARYFLPTEDEWYKAAYHHQGTTDGLYWSYPTQSNTLPGNSIGDSFNQANIYLVNNWWNKFSTESATYGHAPAYHLTPVGSFTGSPGPYGTFDMGGDVCQWSTATRVSATGLQLCTFKNVRTILRGGDWNDLHDQQDLNPISNLYFSGYRMPIYPECRKSTIGFRIAAPVDINRVSRIMKASSSNGAFSNLSLKEGVALGAALLIIGEASLTAIGLDYSCYLYSSLSLKAAREAEAMTAMSSTEITESSDIITLQEETPLPNSHQRSARENFVTSTKNHSYNILEDEPGIQTPSSSWWNISSFSESSVDTHQSLLSFATHAYF